MDCASPLALWQNDRYDGDEDLFVVNSNGTPEFSRNDGAASFTRLSQELAGPPVKAVTDALDVAWLDYDRDGFVDLFRPLGTATAADDDLSAAPSTTTSTTVAGVMPGATTITTGSWTWRRRAWTRRTTCSSVTMAIATIG